jgi:hypothetical protein
VHRLAVAGLSTCALQVGSVGERLGFRGAATQRSVGSEGRAPRTGGGQKCGDASLVYVFKLGPGSNPVPCAPACRPRGHAMGAGSACPSPRSPTPRHGQERPPALTRRRARTHMWLGPSRMRTVAGAGTQGPVGYVADARMSARAAPAPLRQCRDRSVDSCATGMRRVRVASVCTDRLYGCQWFVYVDTARMRRVGAPAGVSLLSTPNAEEAACGAHAHVQRTDALR